MSDLHELTEDVSASPLYNADLAPTTIAQRTWSRWHIAALWVGMAVCIPSYMIASSLMTLGMTWGQAVLTILLGNLIVMVPMALNGHAGTRYGIPLPVYLRASFGTAGAHIPSILRGLVACGWFGIQTWIGGKAIYVLLAVMVPDIKSAAPIGFLGINGWQFACFLFFWAVNLFFIVKGIASIKWLETLAAPVLILIGVAMLAWAIVAGGGLGTILRQSDNFTHPPATATWVAQLSETTRAVEVTLSPVTIDGKPRAAEYRIGDGEWMSLAPRHTVEVPAEGRTVLVQFRDAAHTTDPIAVPISTPGAPAASFWAIFVPALTGMVGFWATLALNIPDFTRYCRSQKDQMVGQFLGLPPTMALYSFIGIAVTCASLVAFDDILVSSQAPWDPVDLLGRFKTPWVVILSMFFLTIATLSTNIAANVVAPANGFANLLPRFITFRAGGIITAVIGVVMMPWKLVERPDAYIFNWLIAYGALLGPIAGIMIADYFIVRRMQLNLADLYKPGGRYGGIRFGTLAILLLAVAPSLPGFLAQVGVSGIADVWKEIFTYAWFVGFAIALVLYSIYGKLTCRTT